MQEIDHDAILARNYILQTLSQDEQDACEARYFADSAFYEVIEAVEWEMLRDLSRGELGGPVGRLFTAIIEESPYLQQKLETLRGLTTPVPVFKSSPDPARSRSWLPQWLTHPMPAWSFALGIFLAAATTVEFSRISLKPDAPAPVQQPPTAPWVVSSGILRGPGESPRPVISVPRGAVMVNFLLPISPGASANTYLVILKNDDSSPEILRQTLANPVQNNALAVEIDRSLLIPGDYHFTVSAEPSVAGEPPSNHGFTVR